MGKFPGRLGFKSGSRKRSVKKKSPTIVDVISLRERNAISLGLDIFHYMFGSDKQVIQDFKGFTVQEIKKSIQDTRKKSQATGLGVVDPSQNREPELEVQSSNGNNSGTLSIAFEKDVEEFYSKSQLITPVPKNESQRKRGRGRPRIHRPEPTSPEKCLDTTSKAIKQISRRRIVHRSTLHSKAPVNTNEFKPTIKKLIADRLLQKAKKSSSCHTNLERSEDLIQDKSANGAARKFVLPYRSAHSSRVIKPSKRCLESEEVLSEPRTNASSGPARLNQTLLKEPKLILSAIKTEHCMDPISPVSLKRFNDTKASSTTKTSSTTKFSGFDRSVTSNSFQNSGDGNLSLEGKRRWKPTYKVHLELHELNVFGAGTSRFSKDQSMNSSSSQNSLHHISSKSPPELSKSSETNVTDEINDRHAFGSFDFGSKSSKMSPNLPIPGTPLCPSPNKPLGGKVVLREARLQLDSKVYAVNEPSSFSKESSNASMPGTVVCGVCGAVRFYKFVKQARKFGIICCESCRKFISKVMLRHLTTSHRLQCLQGEGKGPCQTVPIVRNQQWKTAVLLRQNYKARCPACWLKICLQNFSKMPDTLRRRLAKLLPKNMQDGITFADPNDDQNHVDDAKCPASVKNLVKRKRVTKSEKETHKFKDVASTSTGSVNHDEYHGRLSRKKKLEPGTKVKRKTSMKTIVKKEPNDKAIDKKVTGAKVKNTKSGESYVKAHNKKANLQKHRILEKASKKLVKSSIKQVTKRGKKNADKEKSKSSKKLLASESLRQKQEMKGPRVKHVCRSASVVLGQPKAIFPKLEKKIVVTAPETGGLGLTKKASKGSYCKDCDKTSKAHDCTHMVDISQDTGSKKNSASSADVSKNILTVNQGVEVPSNQSSRKVNKLPPPPPPPPVIRTMQLPRQLPLVEPKSLVSIDFWDYDPDQVTHTGFGLIGSEPFHARAVCFLCGSAGTEKMIHCASCCDPYHRFCLYDGLRDATMSVNNSKDEWRLDWLCQRCTVCDTCGESSGVQTTCTRCRKTYHPSCLDGATLVRAEAAKRPWVCAVCLLCNSCGQAGVMRFVGNLPFCKTCFKLTKKGNYCPICQKCYEDDDFDTKMMECAHCKRWIHAKCEDMSDENYLVLSFLPESVEFVCRLCCALSLWRNSVEDELKSGCKAVIQVLLKKCKNRPLLTHSPPKKRCSCLMVDAPKCVTMTGLGEDLPADIPRRKVLACMSTPESPYAKVKIKDEIETGTQMSNCNLSGPVLSIKEEAGLVNDVSVGNVLGTMAEPKGPPDMAGQTIIPSKQTMTNQFGVCSVYKDSEPKSSAPSRNENSSSQDSTAVEKCGSLSDTVRVASLEELNGPLKLLRVKYNIKDCSVSVQKMESKGPDQSTEDKSVELSDCTLSDCSGRSPEKLNSSSSLTPTDSGIGSTDDELKPCLDDSIRVYAPSTDFDYSSEEPASDVVCHCTENDSPRPTLLSIEKKVYDREFSSLNEFDQEMDRLLDAADCSDLVNIYHRKLKEIFPWFNPIRALVPSVSHGCEEQPHEEAIRRDTPVRNVQSTQEDVWVMPEGFLGKSMDYYYSDSVVKDGRVCSLCRKVGDGLPCEEGRLLYCGQNEWAHANCALWSSEVFEEVDGSLQNVHSAVFRGRKLNCEGCGVKGASVGCCSRNCFATYHFPCAQKYGCRFMEDKTFFCPAHVREAVGKAVQNHEEFDLRRPIYVESERKKKKFVEPGMAKFMVGSLIVERLGIIVPGVSDDSDTIIPADFSCTRLYWSSVEPWRIVQYNIKTIVPEIKCEPAKDHGRNVTIDHELDHWVVRQKLDEVQAWHQQLAERPLDPFSSKISFSDELVVRQVMDSVLETICSREADENLSDPQNTADLLPPELTDAIFEDLPHDLLDGISMQDIFPKLMNYEDCFGTDNITETREHLNEGTIHNVEVEDNAKFHKTSENILDTDNWFEDPKGHVENAADVLQRENENESLINIKELKRSKSEIIPLPIASAVSTRSQKRSCSLTWNCKLDTAKRRKIQGRATRSSGSGSSLEQTMDKPHKLQELRLPDGVLVTLACSTAPTTSIPGTVVVDLKESAPNNGRHRVALQAEEEGKENKCLMWRGRPRLAQLDGAGESSSSGSEADSPPPDVREEEGPVRCSRCRSTYRTRTSYERHLPTCRQNFILSTSESDSETRSSEGDFKREVEDVGRPEKDELSTNDLPMSNENFSFKIDNNHIYGDVQNEMPLNISPKIAEIEPVVNLDVFSESDITVSARAKPKFTYQRPAKPRGRPRTVMKQMSVISQEEIHSTDHSIMSQTVTAQPIVQPTVIVQQVPSANMMPAYIESFQQQTGHSLQYIASIDIQSNAYNKPQYLTNGAIPGTFQIQSGPDFSNLSLMSGVQIAPQPTMLGTIIQQPQTSIQCGMVAQDQIVLGGAPLEVYTDQSGGMFLANQPVYYGLETIVSNTVMSSSQFVSGMPGMVAASSSYSATTTQVYQANKMETILDPTPGYVIVPSSHLPATNVSQCPNTVPMRLPSHMAATQPQAQSLPWASNGADKYKVNLHQQQHPRPLVRKSRPCYMPNPSVMPRPRIPAPLRPNATVTSSSVPRRMSSLKYVNANVVHANTKGYESRNQIRPVQVPVQPRSFETQANVLLQIKSEPKECRPREETQTPAAPPTRMPGNPQTVVVNAIATDNGKGNSKPIKIVLQKSPQNGFYRISHIPQNNSLKIGTQPKPIETKQHSRPSQLSKEIGCVVVPLADKGKVNHTSKQVKRRWQPKGRPVDRPKTAPPRKIVYEVSSKDGFSCTSTSIAKVWEKVFEAVQVARKQHKMPPLSRNPFNVDSRGLEMLGLNHNGFRYLVEQLPGINRCAKYRPRHHEPRPAIPEEDPDSLPEANPSGCCRAEQFGTRAPYDLFSWLASRHRKPPRLIAPTDETAAAGRRAASSNLPMAMRFRHLKETSKKVVGVYRSHIHGRGLFCLRDIEGGEMVIEYAGEVIRSTLTDYREKLYDEKDIGCYMFRIDDHLVVDATLRGNAARFINHSCEPNCYSKVVDILGKKHILIFALRRIPQGEELTYDYKFPFEDIKIPCSCGSRKCRKYLN